MKKLEINFKGYATRSGDLIDGKAIFKNSWAVFQNENPLVARLFALGAFREAYAQEREIPIPRVYEVALFISIEGAATIIKILSTNYVEVMKGMEQEARFYSENYTELRVRTEPLQKLIEDPFVLETFTYHARHAGMKELPIVLVEDSFLLLAKMKERMHALRDKVKAIETGSAGDQIKN